MKTANVAFALLVSPVAALSQPSFPAPDRAAIFNRVAPHFSESAGSPVPGRIRAEGAYRDEGFDVGRPERVMPTGAGMLSAMVSYGDRLEMLLSDTEYFNGLSDNKSGAIKSHVNPLLSPGRLSIELDGASAKDIRKFDQSIDFARGSVVVELETRDGRARIEVSGDMREDNLVISVRDARRARGGASIRYGSWRDSMVVGDGQGMLMGTEAVDTSGIKGWKAQSMSLALRVGCVNGGSFKTLSNGHMGTIIVPKEAAGDFTVIVSAKCAHGKPPLESVHASWDKTAKFPRDRLEAARLDWWKAFWGPSWLDIRGPEADHLARLWYTTLYSYACVGQGPVPPKFNGGPGLVFKDARSWGDGYWWQNQREISFWPMAAAGHAEFTRKSLLFFNQAFETSLDNARDCRLGGLLFREGNSPRDWSVPFGEGYALVEKRLGAFEAGQIAPLEAFGCREKAKEGYNALNFSSGIEFTQAIFDYVQYTGDAEVARKVAAPWLKGEAIMCLGLLTEEADGRYHARCADATEQWWKVDDPAPLLSAIRFALEMTVRRGRALGFEDALISAAKGRLARLAPLPTVSSWSYRTEKPGSLWFCPVQNVVPGDMLLAPFALAEGIRSHNAENPELYAVFPFGLADLNSDPADLARARRTFEHRFFKNTSGWSQCAVQAARLGLPNTIDVMIEHARNHQKWPYGGWNSPAARLYPGGQTVECPFFDAAGVNMTALQESLLQSHGAVGDSELCESGIIRLVPAVSCKWSGQFLLHARGGFAVTVRFANGKVEAACFEASRDARLRVQNPFERVLVWDSGRRMATSEKVIALDVKRGERVVLASSPEQKGSNAAE